MGQWYMGRSDRLFNKPLEFKPERWLDTSDEADRIGPNGMTPDETLRPFSLGPRNCLGKLYVVLLLFLDSLCIVKAIQANIMSAVWRWRKLDW